MSDQHNVVAAVIERRTHDVHDDAVPVLQEAVNSFPPDTQDLNYAYALFNLGKSLRLAGRPDEAIPVLEKRLEIPNQTKVVEAELKKAKKEAGKA